MADDTLAFDFFEAGIYPWRKGKRCENLLCCAASVSQLWSGSSSFGQDKAKVGASSDSTHGTDFGILTAFPKMRCYFEGWSTLSCTSEQLNRWQKKETLYWRLCKEAFHLLAEMKPNDVSIFRYCSEMSVKPPRQLLGISAGTWKQLVGTAFLYFLSSSLN